MYIVYLPIVFTIEKADYWLSILFFNLILQLAWFFNAKKPLYSARERNIDKTFFFHYWNVEYIYKHDNIFQRFFSSVLRNYRYLMIVNKLEVIMVLCKQTYFTALLSYIFVIYKFKHQHFSIVSNANNILWI